jgi:uncharacterized membrane protein YeaQ/YmgE (transglycosylase-associated protein family)
MGLIILIVVGGLLGWLASIAMRTDDRQGILLNVAVGIAGALVVGALTNSGSILLGLSATALVLSLAGSIVVLAVLNLFRRRAVR